MHFSETWPQLHNQLPCSLSKQLCSLLWWGFGGFCCHHKAVQSRNKSEIWVLLDPPGHRSLGSPGWGQMSLPGVKDALGPGASFLQDTRSVLYLCGVSAKFQDGGKRQRFYYNRRLEVLMLELSNPGGYRSPDEQLRGRGECTGQRS